MIVRELLAKMGLDFEEKSFDQADKKIDGLKKGLAALGVALSTGAVAVGLKRMVESTARVGDEIAKKSRRVGIASGAYQELSHAANLSGVSQGSLERSLNLVGRRAAEAAKGTGAAKKMYEELGISVRGADGQLRPSEDLLGDIAEAMRNAATAGDRMRISNELLGDRTGEMSQMLSQGRDGIESMREEARKLGGVMDAKFLKRTESFNDSLTRMDFALQGLRVVVVKAIIGPAEKIIGFFTRVTQAIVQFTEGTKLVETAMAVLGGIAIALAVKMLLPFLPGILIAAKFAAIIAAVILVVEDLWQLFTGGESLIGSLIDKFFGLGASAKFVEDVKLAFERLWTLVQVIASSLLERFRPELEALRDTFKDFFAWIMDLAGSAAKWIGQQLSSMVPDFIKSGFKKGMNFLTTRDEGEAQRVLGGVQAAIAGESPVASIGATARAAVPSTNRTSNVNMKNSVDINVGGPVSEGQKQDIKNIVREQFDESNRNAAAALWPSFEPA